jgi:hypothetical protein
MHPRAQREGQRMSFNCQLLSLEKAIISSPLSTPASTLHRERRSINVELTFVEPLKKRLGCSAIDSTSQRRAQFTKCFSLPYSLQRAANGTYPARTVLHSRMGRSRGPGDVFIFAD